MRAVTRRQALTVLGTGSLVISAQSETTASSTFDALARDVPGFRLITNRPLVPGNKFFDAENRPISLDSFHGDALMVNFWATWCSPCVKEMPVLNDLAREFEGEKFRIVAIASGQQVGMEPKEFYQEYNLDALDLYVDPHTSLMKLFNTTTLPTTLLVGRNGHILGGVIGAADWSTRAAKNLLRELIKT